MTTTVHDAGDRAISVVIPTYNREAVLVDTIGMLLAQASDTMVDLQLIVVDQTAKHEKPTQAALGKWADEGAIEWMRFNQPHLVRAMNVGLQAARSPIVLFLDDDIVPSSNLLIAHLQAHATQPSNVWAVVGQVLQPWEIPENVPYTPRGRQLFRYLDFPFYSSRGEYIENAMAGNLSVKRDIALSLDGFDERFCPPVASRFETEFAKRIVSGGGRIWFEPNAGIKHLRAPSGGTRSKGGHLNSSSPIFSVGDYYYAIKCGRGLERLWYILRKPFREIRTKYHLAHPWWIPIKLIGEARALVEAVRISIGK